MSSFLANCPQCGCMIAKGSACPNCHHSDSAPAPEAQGDLLAEYARRKDKHTQNYTIFMVLMFGTGLIGLFVAYMWWRLIFTGYVFGIVFIVVGTIAIAVLGYMIKSSGQLFPTEFSCPACSVRLDEIGLNGDRCPGCSVKLR